MLVLGIETSCDETAAALLEFSEQGDHRILSEEISSQIELHAAYGGVVPELASREHLRNLPLVCDKVLSSAGKEIKDLNLIGVTRGPGLKGCLLMGLSFAKALAVAHKIPLLGVNHIEGHLLAASLDNKISFPYLALIVSGGHTEIVIVRDVGNYEIVARTIDDAAGEAFDKSANLLGFEYPGGPRLAALADSVSSSPYKLPKVMRESSEFSFSGLKTAISLLIKREGEITEQKRADLSFAIQDSIVDALLFKLKAAIKQSGITQVVVSGGVAANRTLRAKVGELPGIRSYFPAMKHSTDNGAMIAYLAAQRFMRGERDSLDVEALARWPVEGMTINAR